MSITDRYLALRFEHVLSDLFATCDRLAGIHGVTPDTARATLAGLVQIAECERRPAITALEDLPAALTALSADAS